jgi:hypothetical protein
MNDTPRKTTVTLEDLLRVKRAEQPPAEFWAQFEQGLRAKQLAAIVEPRPWWAPFIRISARLSRYQLPVGATAVLAITLFTLREYQPATQSPVFEPAAERVSVAPAVPVVGNAGAVDVVAVQAASNTVVMAEPAPAAAVAVETRRTQAASDPAINVGAASHVVMVNPEFSSARYMADKLAAAQPTDPNLDQMLGHSLRTNEGSSIPSDPLAQINVPGESRLYRLLGGAARLASASTSDSALRLNEQTARHLNERRLSEADVSRLAVGGDRLTVKF